MRVYRAVQLFTILTIDSHIDNMRSATSNKLNESSYYFTFFRVFSRITVIPFNKVPQKQNLGNSIKIQPELKPLMDEAVRSIGTVLELASDFKSMSDDHIFQEVMAMNDEMQDLDMRAQFNYSLLLFSTGKVSSQLLFFRYCMT